MKILLVEDEAALADVIARNLRARGHDVRSAGTAEAALLSMAERWPDALILDVNLPDLTGWEILRRLTRGRPRAAGRDRDLGRADLAEAHRGVPAARRALQKPFPMDALVRADQRLRRRPATRLQRSRCLRSRVGAPP